MRQWRYRGIALLGATVMGAYMLGHQLYRKMLTATHEKDQLLHTLEIEKEQNLLLLEMTMGQAAIRLDPEEHVTSWNIGAERLYGYVSEDILGKHCSCLYANDVGQQATVAQLFQLSKTAGVIKQDCWHLRKDRSQFWGEDIITALRDETGKISGFSKATRKITERKRIPTELPNINLDVQDVDQLRTQFFLDISHELRTPLTVIRGESEVTLRGKDKPIAEYKSALGRIILLLNQLEQLVNDLSFLVRSESGLIQIEKFAIPIHHILTQAASDGRVLAEKKGIAVDIKCQDPMVMIEGDPQRLRQLFMIILDNAINYTKPGGRVMINQELEEGALRVMIRDNGIGIPSESLSQVFNRFYRAPEASVMAQNGSGLGLPIAKWITEIHQGTISLTSSPNTGTTVTVRLPSMSPQKATYADPSN